MTHPLAAQPPSSAAGPKVDVVTIGEGLACLSAPGQQLVRDVPCLVKSFGGAELNTAIGLARLGVAVRWVSRVGADPFGDELLELLVREGVDTTFVQRCSGRTTGLMVKQRLSAHESHVEYYRNGSAATTMTPKDLDGGAVTGARLLHLTGVALAVGPGPRETLASALDHAKRAGLTVTFDPNYRHRLWGPDEARSAYLAVLPQVNHLLCNETEAELLTGETDATLALARLVALGPRTVVIKRGARGAVALVEGVHYEVSAAPAPSLVDTVGAGDAFNAGWITGALDALDTRASLQLAAWAAARVVQHEGDYEGFPSPVECADRRVAAQSNQLEER